MAPVARGSTGECGGCSALRLDNQVLRLRVDELERANQELLAAIAAAASPPARSVTTATVANSEDISCPNCFRAVPAANLEAHIVHCQRNFYRCAACADVLPVRERTEHVALWTDVVQILRAAEQMDIQRLRGMRAHGASLLAALSEETGETLLHIAARQGSLDLAVVTLGHGLPPHAQLSKLSRDGQTALHVAVAGGHEAIVALILESHASPDQRSTSGETPLLVACRQGTESIVRRLIEAHADTDVRTSLGDTALQVAQARGHLDCALALGALALPRQRLGDGGGGQPGGGGGWDGGHRARFQGSAAAAALDPPCSAAAAAASRPSSRGKPRGGAAMGSGDCGSCSAPSTAGPKRHSLPEFPTLPPRLPSLDCT